MNKKSAIFMGIACLSVMFCLFCCIRALHTGDVKWALLYFLSLIASSLFSFLSMYKK